MAEGGNLYEQHKAFLEWAAAYDDGSLDMRSCQLHERWLLGLSCPVYCVDGTGPVNELCDELMHGLVTE